ncbi:MAG: DUF6079 family protein [Dehalococcoidia bacterium]
MTTHGEPQVWLEQFPLGIPQTFIQEHHGLRYTGEVIRAERWSPAWGEPLEGDTYFRIVLLTQRRPNLTPAIKDSRIALWQPGSGVSPRRRGLIRESATNREILALQANVRDEQSEIIRRSLRQRQEELDQEILALDASRYASGRIQGGLGDNHYPVEYLPGSEPSSWFSSIAQRLLSDTYPGSPLGGSSPPPRSISEEDIGQLYGWVMAQSGASAQLLAELGPGLGLSTVANPETFDASQCTVFDEIRKQLAELASPFSWPELHHHLAHQVGLTGPLATLYLLSFLNQERPDLALGLSLDHAIYLLGQSAFYGERLTSDLLPRVRWDRRLSQWITSIEPTTTLSWNEALPYLAPICPDLTPTEEGADLSSLEDRLRETVQQLRQAVERCRDSLRVLSRVGLPDPLESTEAALERLSGLSGSNYLAAHHAVRNTYPDLGQLEVDRNTLELLDRLSPHANDIEKTWSYLQRAAVPDSLAQLSIEKQAVQAAVFQGTLLYLAQNWDALSHQISRFRTNYAVAYREHHEQQRQVLANYRRSFEEARLKLRALELLNTLEELGEKIGLGLRSELEALASALDSCSIEPQDLKLEDDPHCLSCVLTLDQSLSTASLSGKLAEIDATLAEKNRALSNLVVERILTRSRGINPRIQRFIAVVQASDLSALSNTISPDLVRFIRGMLRQQ